MKQKNAFTLIELLLSIIILAILVFIAIPTISGIINKFKKNIYIDNIIISSNSLSTLNVLEDSDDGIYAYRLNDVDVLTNEGSTFGTFLWAYIISKCENSNCEYYYMALDNAGNFVGQIINDETNNSAFILPIQINVVKKEKEKIIFEIYNTADLININDVLDKSNFEYKVVSNFLQMKNAYVDESVAFSIALLNETEEYDEFQTIINTDSYYNVYTTSEHDGNRFILKENKEPMAVGYTINVEMKYALTYNTTKTEIMPFVVLQDKGDTLVAVEQSELFGESNSKYNENGILVGRIKMIQNNNPKIKNIRLLELDDLEKFLFDFKTSFSNNMILPNSLITRLNINNRNTVSNEDKITLKNVQHTLIVDSKGVITGKKAQYITKNEEKIKYKIPTSFEYCLFVYRDNTNKSYLKKLSEPFFTNPTFNYKLVIEIDKNEYLKSENEVNPL